jgi:hypothetical protein
MKANLLRRAGLVMSKLGKIEDASKFLENAFVPNMSMLEKVIYSLSLNFFALIGYPLTFMLSN